MKQTKMDLILNNIFTNIKKGISTKEFDLELIGHKGNKQHRLVEFKYIITNTKEEIVDWIDFFDFSEENMFKQILLRYCNFIELRTKSSNI